MIDRSYIGKRTERRSAAVERGQLRLFAKATGEANPIYFDLAAAQAAGHPDLPAPPTFAFSLDLLAPSSSSWMADLNIDIGRVLHGEQSFEHLHPIHAGDVISLEGRIADIYDKKGGALEFLVMETEASNQHGRLCVRMRTVTVVRNG